MTNSMRLFCAIELPANVRRKITAYAEVVRIAMPEVSASWTRESNLHLTIKFVGDVKQERSENLGEAAARAVKGIRPFGMRIVGTGVFPERGSPRVLWIGIEDPTKELARLHTNLEEESAALGFPSEPRAFHPHLTLARVRRSQGSSKVAAVLHSKRFERIETTADELCVIRSELSSKGSRYTILSRHPLKG